MIFLNDKHSQKKTTRAIVFCHDSMTLLTEKRTADDTSSFQVTINASRDTAALTTAEARSWLGYAFIKAFFSHGLDELLSVSFSELRLNLFHQCLRRWRSTHRRRR